MSNKNMYAFKSKDLLSTIYRRAELTQTEFAEQYGTNQGSISAALGGHFRTPTDHFIQQEGREVVIYKVVEMSRKKGTID